MRKWGYICIGILLLSSSIIGCSQAAPNEQEPAAKVENKRDHDPHVGSSDDHKEKRSNFGDHFIENGDLVAYVTPSEALYVYSHKNEEEFLVHEDIVQFEFYNEYVYYIATDGVTSELDIALQSIYRTDIRTKKTEMMLGALEEDGAYLSPRAFYVHEDGSIAIKQEVGFFYSNYWYDYIVTDMDFTSESQMITLEDEYDYVVNEVKWQEDKMYFLVDRIQHSNDDGTVQIELHSFSAVDGQQTVSENAFPLPSDEFVELQVHHITIHVENDILYVRALDENVEKAAYEIDLHTQEIIKQHP